MGWFSNCGLLSPNTRWVMVGEVAWFTAPRNTTRKNCLDDNRRGFCGQAWQDVRFKEGRVSIIRVICPVLRHDKTNDLCLQTCIDLRLAAKWVLTRKECPHCQSQWLPWKPFLGRGDWSTHFRGIKHYKSGLSHLYIIVQFLGWCHIMTPVWGGRLVLKPN